MNYRTITVKDDKSDSVYVLREGIGRDEMNTSSISLALFPDLDRKDMKSGDVLGVYYYSHIASQLLSQTVAGDGLTIPDPDDRAAHQAAYDALMDNPRYGVLWRRLTTAFNNLVLADPDSDLAPPTEDNEKNETGPTLD